MKTEYNIQLTRAPTVFAEQSKNSTKVNTFNRLTYINAMMSTFVLCTRSGRKVEKSNVYDGRYRIREKKRKEKCEGYENEKR
jgi:hypothetical protein